MTTAIQLDQISKQYPGIKALDEISFEVEQGSIHGFLGPNGAGKSTTMKIIVGLVAASAGKLKLMGEVAKDKRTPIGYLPEIPPLYPMMKVKDYLAFIAKINGNYQVHLVEEVMKKCGITSVSDRVIANLSKGFKQRIGIAQALVFDASLIVLDEPMAGLDPASIQEIRALIQSLAGERTILFSSHQLHDVNLICSDVTIINNGRIIQSAPLESLGQKFQSNQVLMVELERWNDDLQHDLLRHLNCESVKVLGSDQSIKLQLFLSGENDVRSEYSNFFVEKGCGLLGIREEKIDLEEIFSLSMKGERL